MKTLKRQATLGAPPASRAQRCAERNQPAACPAFPPGRGRHTEGSSCVGPPHPSGILGRSWALVNLRQLYLPLKIVWTHFRICNISVYTVANISTCILPTQVAGQPGVHGAIEGLTHAKAVERILAAQGGEAKMRAEQERGATTADDASATEYATTESTVASSATATASRRSQSSRDSRKSSRSRTSKSRASKSEKGSAENAAAVSLAAKWSQTRP